MKYRIYANVRGWDLVDVKPTLDEAVSVVDYLVSKEVKEFIVIEHDNKLDMDTPVITTMRGYLNYKEKQKVKRLGRKA